MQRIPANSGDPLNAIATRAGVVVDVYIEVDVGAHRCGVARGAPLSIRA